MPRVVVSLARSLPIVQRAVLACGDYSPHLVHVHQLHLANQFLQNHARQRTRFPQNQHSVTKHQHRRNATHCGDLSEPLLGIDIDGRMHHLGMRSRRAGVDRREGRIRAVESATVIFY